MASTPRPAGIGALLAALPEAISLTLLAALPAFLNLASERIFEEEKALLLRAAALIAVPGVFLAWRRHGAPLWRSAIVLGVVAFTLVLVVATAGAVTPGTALMGAYLKRHGLATWCALAVMFAAMCVAARTQAGRERLLQATLAGSVWPCVYLLLQRAGADPVTYAVPSGTILIGTTFGNQVLFAGYLAAVIPLTAAQAWRVRTPGRWNAPAIVLALLLALQITSLAASGNRGGLVALAAGAVVFGITIAWTRLPKRTIAGGIIAIGLVAGMLALLPAVRQSSLARRLDPNAGSARVRVLIWRGAIDLMRHSGRRVWLGYGPEQLHAVFPRYYSPEIGRMERVDTLPDRAHNETFDTLVSAGIVGVAVQFVLFAAVVVGALRVADPRLRAGLAAAAVAHIVEIQFGIANVVTRLVFLCIAAVTVGSSTPETAAVAPSTAHKASARRTPAAKSATQHQPSTWRWLLIPALAGALSPLIAMLPSGLTSQTAGTANDLIDYLMRCSLATPLLYATIAAAALAVARRLEVSTASFPAPYALATAAAAFVIIPMSVTPSRADVISQAATAFEAKQQWTEAVIAYSEASRMRPRESYYLAGLGRAYIQGALPLDPAAREAPFRSAREALERAHDLDRSDPDNARHLASLCRLEAWNRDEAARAMPLAEADRLYAESTQLAPGLTALWKEWALVELERHRIASALEKAIRATTLDDSHQDTWVLRGQLYAAQQNRREALAAFDRALALGPNSEATRGRDEVLADLRR